MSYRRHLSGTEGLSPHDCAPSFSKSNSKYHYPQSTPPPMSIPSSSRERLDVPLRYPSSKSMYVPGAGIGEVGFVPTRSKRSSSSSPPRATTRSCGKTRRSRSRSPCTSRGKQNGLMEILLHRPGSIDGTKLSVVGASIQNLDIIPFRISSKIKTVYLSNNDIRDIKNIPQFVNCMSLSLANNLIKFLGDVECLKGMEHLDKLTLEGNPITSMPYYRDYVISICPRLSVLDGVKVSVGERQNAKSKGRKISAILEQLRLNELRLKILQHYSKLFMCHVELGRVVVGRFRFLRGEHVSDVVRTRSVPPGMVLRVTCQGGVYRWLQIGCRIHFDELVQLKASRAAVIKSKQMGIANRADNAMISWDSIISECLRIQQEQFLELIERCERETNVINDVHTTATSAERGLPTIDTLDLIQQIQFITPSLAEHEELVESHSGRAANEGGSKTRAGNPRSYNHRNRTNVVTVEKKYEERKQLSTDSSFDLPTHDKYRSLLRCMAEGIPVKESNVFDPKVSMSQLLPPQQEEPDEVRLLQNSIMDVVPNVDEYAMENEHRASMTTNEKTHLRSDPEDNAKAFVSMDNAPCITTPCSVVKSHTSLQDMRDLLHKFEDIDGFEKIVLESENTNHLDYLWDISHIDALDESRKEEYLGPRPLPIYGTADTIQQDNRISSMKGLQSRLEELVDELASVGHVFDVNLRSHLTLRRTADELTKSMTEAAKTSSDYTARLTKKIKETHTTCLEASLALENLKGFYAEIEEEENKLKEAKARKDMICMERVNVERKQEMEVETKEELLKSINQIIVTIQNIDSEIKREPELRTALSIQRFKTRSFSSALLVAKRHVFLELRKRIARQQSIRKFTKKMCVISANRIVSECFNRWNEFHSIYKRSSLLQARSHEKILDDVFKSWLRSMNNSLLQKKAEFRWGVRRSKEAIAALKDNVHRSKIISAKDHKRGILLSCFVSYRCFKAWYSYTVAARNLISVACDGISSSNDEMAKAFHLSTMFKAWQRIFAEKHSKRKYLQGLVVRHHAMNVIKYGWRCWKNIYHAMFYCKLNYQRRFMAYLHEKLLKNRLYTYRMIRAEEHHVIKIATQGFRYLKSFLRRSRRISAAFHRVCSNTYYRTVISVWDKWKNDWYDARKNLVQSSHALEFYLHKLLVSTIRGWKKFVEMEKAWIEYDESLDKTNDRKVVSFGYNESLENNLDKKISAEYNMNSDTIVDEEDGLEMYVGVIPGNMGIHQKRLQVTMKKLRLHCYRQNKRRRIKEIIRNRHSVKTKSWVICTFRFLLLRSRLNQISVVLEYFNTTTDDISTQIETKKSEVLSIRNEKAQLVQSVGLLNCDLAAKQVEFDSLQLQFQELDVLMGTMYSSYSATLSERRRLEADYDAMSKNYNDRTSVAEMKSRIDGELLSHEQEKDQLVAERTKLCVDLENEKKDRKLLIASRNSEGTRNKAHLASLQNQHSRHLERYHAAEKSYEILLAQRVDSEKLLQTCQATLQSASGRIDVKVKSNEEELQSLLTEEEDLMRRNRLAKGEEADLMAELVELDEQINGLKRSTEEDSSQGDTASLKKQVLQEIDATDYLTFASAEKNVIDESVGDTARGPTIIVTPMKHVTRKISEKKSSSFNKPKVIRRTPESGKYSTNGNNRSKSTRALHGCKQVSNSPKEQQTFLSPVSVAVESPMINSHLNDGGNDPMLKAELEIANVSKRIRERLGSVL